MTPYLQVALLVGFPELPSGGPELRVNLAVIIVVLGWVIHLVIILVVIIVIIIPVLLFLFLFPFPSLHFSKQLTGSMHSSSFILNHLLSSVYYSSRMYFSHMINQLII